MTQPHLHPHCSRQRRKRLRSGARGELVTLKARVERREKRRGKYNRPTRLYLSLFVSLSSTSLVLCSCPSDEKGEGLSWSILIDLARVPQKCVSRTLLSWCTHRYDGPGVIASTRCEVGLTSNSLDCVFQPLTFISFPSLALVHDNASVNGVVKWWSCWWLWCWICASSTHVSIWMLVPRYSCLHIFDLSVDFTFCCSQLFLEVL